MLGARTTLAVRDMAKSLRQEALGRWFTENRPFVIAGILLSAAAISFLASPHNKEHVGSPNPRVSGNGTRRVLFVLHLAAHLGSAKGR